MVELRHAAALALAITSGVVGCGGRVVEEPPGTEKPETTDPAPSSTGAAGTGSSPGSPTKLPSHPLGDCVPGFDHGSNPSRACPWVTQNGQCFNSEDAACACICPTSGGSLCSSNFSPGPGGTTTVYCDKL
jgi:hypothetical protein